MFLAFCQCSRCKTGRRLQYNVAFMGSESGEIRTHLQKILASAVFANAERMRRFLNFIVEYTLSQPKEPLKEMTVGLELYSSGGEFDPRLSAVVRVDAKRLRTKLQELLRPEGASDPLIIDLPKGSYAPIFREHSIQPASPPPSASPAEPSIIWLRAAFSNLSPRLE